MVIACHAERSHPHHAHARRSPHKEVNPELVEVETELEAAYVQFADVLRQRPTLWIRLYDSLGYKTHEREELEQFRCTPARSQEDNLAFGVDLAFQVALESLGFTWGPNRVLSVE